MKRAALTIGVAFAVGVIIAFPVGLHCGRSGRLIQVETSPDGRERLEFYRPSPLQQWLGYGDGDYAVARLSRTADSQTIATSAPLFYDGAGPTHWNAKAIDVGVAARFDRTTNHWTVD